MSDQEGGSMKRIALCALALLAGCASGYQQFYRSNPSVDPTSLAERRVGPAPATPLVDHMGSYSPQIVSAYESNGYFPIGYSDFTSGARQWGDGAVEQGKRVGADLVVEIDPQYAGQASTVIPITTPNNSTSYTTGSATAYGPYGSTTAYGSATTTTYGTQTNYVPITIQRFEYGALYFVKVKMGFGVYTTVLTDEQRQMLQSNHGVTVNVVVRGSPAFEADILPGDIVLAMAGTQVSMPADLKAIAQQHEGQTIEVSIYRNGQTITKNVAVPNYLP
jgi:hypothetical protein